MSNLDRQQQAAVKTDSRSALVIAGAGSGKTRVLIERIAYLVESRKVSPFEILSFSFTRKASGEIRERLESRIGNAAHRCTLGTMHSIGLQMVRKFGELIGLKPHAVTVYGSWESEFLLKEVALEIGFFKKAWRIPKRDIDAMFADYYDRMVEPDESNPGYALFMAFMQRCRENNSLTYDGLLVAFRLLLPQIGRFMHIKHILVDEIQDISPGQWNIINGLVEACGTALFVVGDLRQSVYKFRGAVPEYLLQHQDDFAIYELQSNYRSVPAIVNAANRLMEHSKEFIGGGMVATRPDGMSRLIVEKNMDSAAIAELMVLHLKLSPEAEPTAILSRNHVLLRKLSDELSMREVPHQYVGRKSALTNSEEFRRFHGFLKLLCNVYDNMSFLLIKDLIGLTREEYADIRVTAVMEGKSHFQAWKERYPGDNEPDSGWFQFFGTVSEWNLIDVARELDDIFNDPNRGHDGWNPPFDFSATIGFLNEYLLANRSGTIQQYLDWLATYDIQDELTDKPEGLTLTTIHGSKGLEWPVVIVAGCNEGIMPSKQSIASGDLEEERRLFYVALTRAKDQLILCVRPETTESNGKTYTNPVSRFIGECQNV